MVDYNGSSFEMGRLWGQLQAHMHHHGQTLERQNEILLDIKDGLHDLPGRLAGMMTATPASAIPRPTALSETRGVLKALYPILKATIALLLVVGLMTGGLSWTDIQKLFGLGAHISTS
jgi:hypothetical protein